MKVSVNSFCGVEHLGLYKLPYVVGTVCLPYHSRISHIMQAGRGWSLSNDAGVSIVSAQQKTWLHKSCYRLAKSKEKSENGTVAAQKRAIVHCPIIQSDTGRHL